VAAVVGLRIKPTSSTAMLNQGLIQQQHQHQGSSMHPKTSSSLSSSTV
jgi:hypothetical protein